MSKGRRRRHAKRPSSGKLARAARKGLRRIDRQLGGGWVDRRMRKLFGS